MKLTLLHSSAEQSEHLRHSASVSPTKTCNRRASARAVPREPQKDFGKVESVGTLPAHFRQNVNTFSLNASKSRTAIESIWLALDWRYSLT